MSNPWLESMESNLSQKEINIAEIARYLANNYATLLRSESEKPGRTGGIKDCSCICDEIKDLQEQINTLKEENQQLKIIIKDHDGAIRNIINNVSKTSFIRGKDMI